MSTHIQVKIESGILKGCVTKNKEDSGKEYYSFQGIPYARSPIGELRFKAPEKVQPWKGVRDATKDGDQCFSGSFIRSHEKAGSEDCLSLNVFTPKLPIQTEDETKYELLPVMVFIHGGAFTYGSNSKTAQNPEYLIREDVVIVVINYRIGLLGFLSFDDPSLDIPGNAGFKDMVMALKWVNENIKTFNGDSNNVTILGQSAGAASVHLLMLSPAAKGLFHKAILQSGCAISVRARAIKHGLILSEMLGIEEKDERRVLEILKNMTVEEIHELQEKIPDPWYVSKIRPFGSIVENTNQKGDPFLTREPLELIRKGEYNKVPVMMGYNSREGMFIFTRCHSNSQELLADMELNVPFHLGLKKGSVSSRETAEKIFRFYFGDQDPTHADIDNFYKLLSDNFFIRDLYRSATLHAKNNSQPIYLYEMTLETSLNVFQALTGVNHPGVNHGDELAYLFNLPINGKIIPGSAEDLGIRRFCRLWTNFAKYGNPNSPVDDTLLPVEWKPFTLEEKYYCGIGDKISSKQNPIDSRMKFWEELYETIQ